MIHKKASNGDYEEWWKYDTNNILLSNKRIDKTINNLFECQYNSKGDIINERNSLITPEKTTSERWFEYEYDSKNHITKRIEYYNFSN